MHLLTRLILGLCGVVALCLAAAVTWIAIDTHRSIDASVAATAARVGPHLESLFWQRLVWRGGMMLTENEAVCLCEPCGRRFPNGGLDLAAQRASLLVRRCEPDADPWRDDGLGCK